jgi:hypothetical protein
MMKSTGFGNKNGPWGARAELGWKVCQTTRPAVETEKKPAPPVRALCPEPAVPV